MSMGFSPRGEPFPNLVAVNGSDLEVPERIPRRRDRATDCARDPCHRHAALESAVLDAAGGAVRAMRDPTRGGLASTLNEIAQASGVGMVIDETKVPVRAEVQSACELLGLDPVYVANEGKAVFFVSPDAADKVLEALRAHPLGRKAVCIGQATAEHKGMLVARTAMGASRVIPMQISEQLPRIC